MYPEPARTVTKTVLANLTTQVLNLPRLTLIMTGLAASSAALALLYPLPPFDEPPPELPPLPPEARVIASLDT